MNCIVMAVMRIILVFWFVVCGCRAETDTCSLPTDINMLRAEMMNMMRAETRTEMTRYKQVGIITLVNWYDYKCHVKVCITI